MFKKWHSIENSYREKHINWFIERFPELVDEPFIITEKLHGSNFQWYIQPNESIMVGSRNNFLDLDESFQGVPIRDLWDAHENLLQHLQASSNLSGDTCRLFGELFGKGIQKGVNYGDEKRLLYFGLMIDDVLLEHTIFQSIVHADYRVPEIFVSTNFQDALEYNSKFDSRILNQEGNICEGVVIQPYRKHFFDNDGSPFILKKKNDEFKEKQKAKKVMVIDDEVIALNNEFRGYINDNRLQSVFSKEGEIETPNQIGDYIRFLLVDAKDEFVKDFLEVEQLSKSQQKQVYNVGGIIVNMLKGYL